MDIFDHARNHHRRAVQLIGEVKAAQSDAQCRAALAELQNELRVHEHVEAELLYPALQNAGGMQAQVGSLLGEHSRFKALSARVNATQPNSDEWRQALEDLASSLSRHVNAEESQIFPRARDVLDDDLLDRLASEAGDSTDAGEGEAFAAGARRTAHDAAGRIEEQADRWTGEARQRLGSLLREQGRTAAGQGQELASALRDTGENLQRQGNGELGHYVVEAADGLARWVGYLERGEVDQLLEQVRSAARRHPVVLFGGAVGAGFLVSRFLRSSGTRDRPDDEQEAAAWLQEVERVDPRPGRKGV